MSLTDSQEKILTRLALVSALFSICGSAMILIRIIRCKSWNTPYNRIMIGLSISDLISSSAAGFGVFLLPTETSTRPEALGNVTTCNILGFFSQLALLAVAYNGLLSLYYLMTVRYGVKRDEFARRYEPWLHASTIVFFLGTGAIGLALNMYGENEVTQGCWIGEYPENCGEEGNCKSNIIGIIFGGLPLVLVFFGLPINNLVIYYHVRKTIRQVPTDRPHDVPSPELDEVQNDRVREVAHQGFLYVVFFYVSYFPAFVLRILDGFVLTRDDEANIYWVLVIYSVFVPLQGWFNLFIYMRPNYTRVRTANPDRSVWWVMKVAWWELRLPTLKESHSISSNRRQKRSSTKHTPGQFSTIGRESERGSQSQGSKVSRSSKNFSKTSSFSRISNLESIKEEDDDNDSDVLSAEQASHRSHGPGTPEFFKEAHGLVGNQQPLRDALQDCVPPTILFPTNTGIAQHNNSYGDLSLASSHSSNSNKPKRIFERIQRIQQPPQPIAPDVQLNASFGDLSLASSPCSGSSKPKRIFERIQRIEQPSASL